VAVWLKPIASKAVSNKASGDRIMFFGGIANSIAFVILILKMALPYWYKKPTRK
jgi:hypothetical protein